MTAEAWFRLSLVFLAIAVVAIFAIGVCARMEWLVLVQEMQEPEVEPPAEVFLLESGPHIRRAVTEEPARGPTPDTRTPEQVCADYQAQLRRNGFENDTKVCLLQGEFVSGATGQIICCLHGKPVADDEP